MRNRVGIRFRGNNTGFCGETTASARYMEYTVAATHRDFDSAKVCILSSVWYMPIPVFVAELRELVGTRPLWLMAAHAAVTNAAGDLLLCRRADDDQWSIPGGIIEPGEQPADAVVRECREEAGINVEPTSLALVDVSPTFTYPSGDHAQYLDLIFRCSHVSGHAHIADGESTAVQWFSPHHLPVLDRYQHRQIALALTDTQRTVFASTSAPTA